MELKNITLIGTSHIAKESLEKIKTAFGTENPDIICLELDKIRLNGLLEEQKKGKKEKINIMMIPKIGLNGFIFALIGSWAQKKLGNIVGVKPGSEMLLGYKLAKQNNKKIELIDQDLRITLKRFSAAFRWREKFRIVKDIFVAIFSPKKRRLTFDLTKVPEDKLIRKLLDEVKLKYPSIYKVLVTERNEYMAKKIAEISENNPDSKIMAIIGAGHKKEMIDLIKKFKLKESSNIIYNYSFDASY